MQITVEAVTKESRSYQGKTQWGVKTPEGKWYSLYVTDKPAKGQTFEVTVTERTVNGKTYVDAYPVKASSNGTGAAVGGGKILWDECRAFAEAAHELAKKLEPDEVKMDDLENRAVVMADRSTARAAILNTFMIAFTNGKVFVPLVDDDIPW